MFHGFQTDTDWIEMRELTTPISKGLWPQLEHVQHGSGFVWWCGEHTTGSLHGGVEHVTVMLLVLLWFGVRGMILVISDRVGTKSPTCRNWY